MRCSTASQAATRGVASIEPQVWLRIGSATATDPGAAYPLRMNGRPVARIGAVLAAIGAAVAVVFFFQPWRSCPYEDTAVGCAMLPRDASVMIAGFLMAMIGIAVATIGVVSGRQRPTR